MLPERKQCNASHVGLRTWMMEDLVLALSNIEVVCLQGLGVGLQLRRSSASARVDDDTVWNLEVVLLRTLYCFFQGVFESRIAFIASS